MNVRVTLAAVCAAALSFACADKQAVIPELEEAMKAPPGMKVVGLYRMDVTPVETASGVQFAFQPIPVGRDGNALTNPPNTVQVAGAFGAVTTTGPGGCAGVSALTAAVTITNFTIDPLRNVWADVIDMSGHTGNTACNSTSSFLSETYFAIADMSQGIWKYNDLAPAPNATGQVAGGASLPIGGVWGFRYVTLTPFQFFFRVVADDQSPRPTVVDPAGPLNPLTWTSAVAANTRLEICPSNPGFVKGAPCPVALTLSQAVAGAGAGPWTYSFAPSTLVQGQQYWWRVRNVYAAGASTFTSSWIAFTYNGVLPTVPPVAIPANAAANLGFSQMLAWTTPLSVQDTWVVLCSPACPPSRPIPPATSPAILVDQAVIWDGFPGTVSTYSLFVGAPPLVQDVLTGAYLDPAATYDWRVYNYDQAAGTPALGAPHTAGSLTVTPVAIAPVIAAPGTSTVPVVYSLAGTTPFTVTFTTAAPTVTAGFDLLDVGPNGTGFPFYTTPVLLNGVLNGLTGLYDYSVDLRPLVPGTGSYLMTVSNGDLLGTYGAPHYFNVTP